MPINPIPPLPQVFGQPHRRNIQAEFDRARQRMAEPVGGAGGRLDPPQHLNIPWVGDDGQGVAELLGAEPFKALTTEFPIGGDIELHRIQLPKFKLPYDNFEEVQLRLANSIILINRLPYVVETVHSLGDNRTALMLRQYRLRKRLIAPLDAIDDLRPVPPGYITFNGVTAFLSRNSDRIYQQGLTTRNAFLSQVGTGRQVGIDNLYKILEGLAERKTTSWDNNYKKLFQRGILGGLRLNNNTAVFKNEQDGNLCVEYKQRYLGQLEDDVLKSQDELRPWMVTDLQSVGIKC